MNGNDYLPKLRGSSGFDKLVGCYLRLLRKWVDDEKEGRLEGRRMTTRIVLHKHGMNRPRPFLVDPDTLEFNLPFCLAFFRRLVSSEPHLVSADVIVKWKRFSQTPLSQMNNLVDGNFLPGPVVIFVIRCGTRTRMRRLSRKIRRRDHAKQKAADDQVERVVMTLGTPPAVDDSGGMESRAPGYYRFEIES